MGIIQCALGMGLANVLYECDYPMCPVNGASQCALGMGLDNVPWELPWEWDLSNVPWEWDYPMCSVKELANVLCKWDYPMYPGNGTIKCVLERN